MPFLLSYDHDIFVSYAHGPVPLGNFGGERLDPLSRWTQAFVDDLRCQVDYFLTIKDPDRRVDFWMDPELEGNQPLAANLQTKVERSALVLVVMSPFYLQSDWCGREVAWFAATLPQRADAEGRLFVARIDATDEAAWPKPLKDGQGVALPGYRFHPPVRPGDFCEPFGWPKPTDDDHDYHDAVGRLARDITKQLQRLAWLADNPAKVDGAGNVPPSVGRRICLGYMHDTLSEGDEDVPEELRNAFAGDNLTVLPPPGEAPTDEASLKRALETYLPQAEAFLLVANEYCGQWPTGQSAGFISYQLEQANAHHVPSYLWLQVPDIGKIRRPDYRAYLQELEQEATQKKLELFHDDLAGFVTYVRSKLDKPKEPDPGVERLAVVCTNRNAGSPEHEILLKNIAKVMDDRLLPSWIAPVDPDTGQIRLEKLKEMLDLADTILIVCFDQNYNWANRLWAQIKSNKLLTAQEARRVFLIGPRDVGSGEFNLPKFLRIDATNGKPSSSLADALQ